MVFDLKSLDTVAASNAGAEIELRHPVTNAPIGVFVSVVGKDSDTYRTFQRLKFNEYLRAEQQAKMRGRQPNQKSAEDYEDDMLSLLVACTRGWRGMVYEGEELAFTAENVRKVYQTQPWIRDQVNEAVGDLGNFLKT